ncbi:MAG: multicopper oxidase domain-containing protein [Gammaproteobacteria bacterium]|nr:MAG: multicopper oxidase domain-containing protein [Gammaproteobacteria bacterium]
MKRRTFLLGGLGVAAGVTAVTSVPFARSMGSMMMGQGGYYRPSIKLQDFSLPALDEGSTIQGKQVFKLSLQSGESRILPKVSTPTIGINQNFLAPVLRFKKNQTVRMEVTNKLNEVAALHWHGMILPATQDGNPHQAIKPGDTWVAEWSIINEPATYFYHSHTHNHTGGQVWRGLGGQMQIVDEDRDAQLGIPHQYGVDDFPVIITDRAFAESGAFYYSNSGMQRMQGMHGNIILVNGVANSVLKPKKSLIRLRLHNASNARFYHLHFSDNRPFQLVATDGGLLEQPQTLDKIHLAPAERAEIIVDVSDGKAISLRNKKGYGNLSTGMMSMMGGANSLDSNFDVLYIDASKAGKVAAFNTKQLVSLPDWSNVNVATTRKLQLDMKMGPAMMFGTGGFFINNKAYDLHVINEVTKANTFEVWELHNPSITHHPIHVHNTQFRILDRDGRPPYSWEGGLKDTVAVHADEMVRILVPTGPYKNAKIPYMYHCHILEHEDAGMMGQFTVT